MFLSRILWWSKTLNSTQVGAEVLQPCYYPATKTCYVRFTWRCARLTCHGILPGGTDCERVSKGKSDVNMRIVVVSQYLNRRSGHSRQALELVRCLERLGESTFAISINPTDLVTDSVLKTTKERPAGSEFDPLLEGIDNIGLWNAHRGVLADVDLIHCFDISSAMMMKKYCQKRLNKTPPIVVSVTSPINLSPRDILDAGPLSLLNLLRPGHLKKLIVPPTITSSQLNGFDMVLCHSSFMQKRLLDNGVWPSHVAAVGYGIDATNLPQSTSTDSGGTIKVQYLGWGSSLRGTLDALDAFMLSKSLGFDGTIRFDIVGSHTLEENFIVSKILRTVRSQSCVELNYGYNPGIRNIIAESDIILLPFASVYGYCHPPLSLLESMLLGKPVVTTGIGSVPEYVKHMKSGMLVKPHDIGDIAQCLSTLADPRIRKTIGETAISDASRMTDWRVASRGVLSCYERVTRH